jgi:hypothetical protein
MLPRKKRKRLNARVAALEWRKAKMPWYWTCPHEFVLCGKTLRKKDYKFIAKLIEKHGREKKWRTREYCFLFVGQLIYWRIDEVINRTDRRALLRGGYPPQRVLAQIRKRFWPTKADRLKYKKQ